MKLIFWSLVFSLLFYVVLITFFTAKQTINNKDLHRSYDKRAEQLVGTETLKNHSIGYLREGYHVWRNVFRSDALLGFRVLPNKVLYIGGGAFLSNSQGFMSSGESNFEYKKDKPKETFRVVVLGGSTVFGYGVVNSSYCIPAYIKKALEKEIPTKNLEVINAGVYAYTSFQEFLYLATELAGYAPDLVIVYDGWNDENITNVNLSKSATWNPYHTSDYVANQNCLDACKTIKGSFQHLCENILLSSDFLLELSLLHNRRPVRSDEIKKFHIESVNIYAQNIQLMLALCKFRKIRIGVFLQPIAGVSGENIPKQLIKDLKSTSVRNAFYYHARNEFKRLKGQWEKQGIAHIEDLSASLVSFPNVYVDSGHINAQGNEIMANVIVGSLKRSGLLSTSINEKF